MQRPRLNRNRVTKTRKCSRSSRPTLGSYSSSASPHRQGCSTIRHSRGSPSICSGLLHDAGYSRCPHSPLPRPVYFIFVDSTAPESIARIILHVFAFHQVLAQLAMFNDGDRRPATTSGYAVQAVALVVGLGLFPIYLDGASLLSIVHPPFIPRV